MKTADYVCSRRGNPPHFENPGAAGIYRASMIQDRISGNKFMIDYLFSG
jgi:hypothetical protein